ncbi:MAG: Crp/Fnr family transcriptional regulator [Roseivirga sp.]|nr:Crp/Fnr family transcriptional regulator [Roseivirga sp.]
MESARAHLKEIIYKKVNPTDEEWLAFIESWEFYEFPKNQILTDFEEQEEYFYFVHEGVIRAYFEKGAEEYNIGFSYQGEFSGVYDSFVHRKPASYCLETLAPICGLRINYENLTALYDEYKVFERWGRLFNEMILTGFDRFMKSLLADSAEERFNRLMSQSPHVFQLIPQKHLASYLGMTPETFSRMRKKSMC